MIRNKDSRGNNFLYIVHTLPAHPEFTNHNLSANHNFVAILFFFKCINIPLKCLFLEPVHSNPKNIKLSKVKVP